MRTLRSSFYSIEGNYKHKSNHHQLKKHERIGNTFNLLSLGMLQVYSLHALETLCTMYVTCTEEYAQIGGKVNAQNAEMECLTETCCSLKGNQAFNERAAWLNKWVSHCQINYVEHINANTDLQGIYRTSDLSRRVSEEEEVKEKEEWKQGSWSHSFVCQENSKTKAQKVVVFLYSLRSVEINGGCLVGIYRIFIRREIKRFFC